MFRDVLIKTRREEKFVRVENTMVTEITDDDALRAAFRHWFAREPDCDAELHVYCTIHEPQVLIGLDGKRITQR